MGWGTVSTKTTMTPSQIESLDAWIDNLADEIDFEDALGDLIPEEDDSE